MHNLSGIFKKVINSLNDIPFAQHHSVIKWHKFVLHVRSQSSHQVYSILKKKVEQFLGNISFVCKQLAIEAFSKDLEHFWVFVADIGTCQDECDNLTSVIAGQMELETMAPAHCPLAIRGYAVKNLVGITSQVVTYRNHGGIHE